MGSATCHIGLIIAVMYTIVISTFIYCMGLYAFYSAIYSDSNSSYFILSLFSLHWIHKCIMYNIITMYIFYTMYNITYSPNNSDLIGFNRTIKWINPYSVGIDLRRQNLTSVDLRF